MRKLNPNSTAVPALQVPAVPAPPMPQAPVPAPPMPQAPIPAPTQYAPPQVPGYAPVPQAPVPAPSMQAQLEPVVYQQNVLTPPMAPAPPVQAQTVAHIAPPVQQTARSPMHMDMGDEPVKVFKIVPAGEMIEAEITKAELGVNKNNNQQIKLQLRAMWPKQHESAMFFDQVVLTAAAQWKYKSLCAACEDANGNRLLSADNRFFTGTGVEDFVGNVVRFRSDEPQPGQDGTTFYNRVKGGFESCFEVCTQEEAPALVVQPNGVGSSVPPPVPQF